jgi:hypothetical protein
MYCISKNASGPARSKRMSALLSFYMFMKRSVCPGVADARWKGTVVFSVIRHIVTTS